MTPHLSYEIIFHVGGLKLAVIDITCSCLKVIHPPTPPTDNREASSFYVSSKRPLDVSER